MPSDTKYFTSYSDTVIDAVEIGRSMVFDLFKNGCWLKWVTSCRLNQVKYLLMSFQK